VPSLNWEGGGGGLYTPIGGGGKNVTDFVTGMAGCIAFGTFFSFF